MTTFTDQVMILPSTGIVQKIAVTDSIVLTGQSGVTSLSLTNGDMFVGGDLTVAGNTISMGSEIVNIADNHLYLNKDYTTVAAETGGLVVNYLPTSTNDTSDTGGFATTSTIKTVGAATFAATDFIQISGADTEANDGIYEVLSHSGNTLTIDTTPAEDFSQNILVVDTGDTTAVITKVNLSILRAGTDGIWETASGSQSGLSFTNLTTGAGNSLDAAYGVGSSVTVDTGAVAWNSTITGNAMEITSSSNTMTGAALDISFTGNLSTSPDGIIVDFASASGLSAGDDALGISLLGKANGGGGDSVGVSIDGNWDQGIENASSLVQTGSASFTNTFAHTGSTFDVSATGAITLDSTGGAIGIGTDADAQNINIGTGGAARTITVGNVTGATAVNLNAGTGGMTFTSTGTGDITIDSDNGLHLDADTALEINSSASTIEIGNDAVSQAINIGVSSSTRAIIIGNAEAGSSVSLVSDSSASGGSISITASGSASTITIDSGDALSINSSGGAINIGDVGNSQPINIGTGAAARTITVGNATGATAIDFDAGTSGTEFTFTTAQADTAPILNLVNTSDQASIFAGSSSPDARVTGDVGSLFLDGTNANAYINTDGSQAWSQFATTNGVFVNEDFDNGFAGVITSGDALYLHTVANDVGQADATTTTTGYAVGFATGGTVGTTTYAQTVTVPMLATQGSIVRVNTDLSGTGDNATIGDVMYLSETAGEITKTPPTTSGSVIYRVGWCTDNSTVAGGAAILFSPQFIAVN